MVLIICFEEVQWRAERAKAAEQLNKRQPNNIQSIWKQITRVCCEGYSASLIVNREVVLLYANDKQSTTSNAITSNKGGGH